MDSLSAVLAVLLVLSSIAGTFGQQDGGGSSCPENLDADVLIMGAGMAGVTAAKTLYQSGIRNFLILEGTDRIGGRLRDEQFSGVTVELGANWIQGVPDEGDPPGDNPLWQLQASGECPLNGTYFDYDSFHAFEGMKDVTNETHSAIERYWTAEAIVTELSQERSRQNLPDISVREGFLMNTTWNPSTNVENLVDWFLFDFCFAEPPELSSLYRSKPLATYEYLGDYDYVVTDQNGFVSLVECIGRDFLSNDSIVKLNTNVTMIRWSDECVCAETMGPEGPSTFCANFGIVTFSVGVLQRWVDKPNEEPSFQPPLPEDKTNAINAFSMAHYLKIFVNFTEVFWNTTKVQILHVDQERGRFPHIYPLRLAPTDDLTNILIITVVENEALSIIEQPENETREEIMQVLRGIYGNEIPDIDNILIPDWYKNPFFLGSYSNIPVGVDASTHEELSSPEGNLYLCGEAAELNYSGFAHGAYFSGVTTAQSVAEAIKGASSAPPPPSPSPSPTPSGQSTLSPPLAFFEVLLVALLFSITFML